MITQQNSGPYNEGGKNDICIVRCLFWLVINFRTSYTKHMETKFFHLSQHCHHFNHMIIHLFLPKVSARKLLIYLFMSIRVDLTDGFLVHVGLFTTLQPDHSIFVIVSLKMMLRLIWWFLNSKFAMRTESDLSLWLI